MRPTDFQWMTRLLLVSLPIFMGAVEYMLRVAMGQPDQANFFPISLAAAGVSLNVSATAVPHSFGHDAEGASLLTHDLQLIFIAKLGVFTSIGGTLLWLYLLTASMSEKVSMILPFHPFWDAVFYYLFSCMVTEWKASVEEP